MENKRILLEKGNVIKYVSLSYVNMVVKDDGRLEIPMEEFSYSVTLAYDTFSIIHLGP